MQADCKPLQEPVLNFMRNERCDGWGWWQRQHRVGQLRIWWFARSPWPNGDFD